MTLAAFLKENNSKLKTAKKLQVRDLDQLNEFETVAYVDDKNESYDVKIVINNRKKIVATVCDCDEGGICKHIVALVLNLSADKKTQNILKKATTKKQTESELLLKSLDNDTLRIWISELLNTNKELAFLFKNQFGIREKSFDPEYIKKAIDESLQSIIGKRRKIETNEVKKFIDSLAKATRDLLEHIYHPPITPEKYLLLRFLVDELINIDCNYDISSIKIKRFIETIYDNLLKNLFTIKDIEVWKKSVELYFSLLFQDRFLLSELHQCEKIYEFSKTNEMQQKIIVQIIEENSNVIIEKSQLNYHNLVIEMETFILNIFIENNLFKKYASKFRPKMFQNEHNIRLLDALMEIEHYEEVQLYCNQIIERNYQEKYNIPYIKYLIAIYKNNKEDGKLAKLYSVYGKFIYDIDVYLFIKENLPLDDFKKYRMSVFSYARNSYQNGDISAFDFYYEIKKLDEKQDDLFEMLQNSRNHSYVNKYKEIAFNLNQNKFMTLLFRFGYESKHNQEYISSIAHFIIEKMDRQRIILFLKQFSIYNDSSFYRKLLELAN